MNALEIKAAQYCLEHVVDRGFEYVDLPDGSQITAESGVFVRWFVYPDGYPSNSPDFETFEGAMAHEFIKPIIKPQSVRVVNVSGVMRPYKTNKNQ